MDELSIRRITEKLEPQAIRSTMIRAGLYLAAFELLSAEVVDKVKAFFVMGFDQHGYTYSPDYATKVLSLDRNIYNASCKWLVTVEAVTTEQATELQAIRVHRNLIAHELPKLLIDPSIHLNPWLLERCRFYIGLLGRFWGGIEADTNPDFAGAAIDYKAIKSGTSLLMDYIWEIVDGAPPNQGLEPTR